MKTTYNNAFDHLVIGGGIIGLTLARSLKQRFPSQSIAILEKEDAVARHASGRNSGVLHAGFYYTADSLKAQFCRDGSRLMAEYCKTNNLALEACGKVVITRDEPELAGLEELARRGEKNGVYLEPVDERQLRELEPAAVTYRNALYVPSTASVDPQQVCAHMANELASEGVTFFLSCRYLGRKSAKAIDTTQGAIAYGKLWNCAGLYADKIAHDFGVGLDYSILPFKGLYLMAGKGGPTLKKHIYPVPNLANPFLGVHFTKTVAGKVKIGPTATPAFWREHYNGLDGFNPAEASAIMALEAQLLITNRFNFRHLAMEEIRKYAKSYLRQQAAYMVRNMDMDAFDTWSRPGIRAQLIHRKTLKLEQDFIVEPGEASVHVLNAVSPAFTCSIPFTQWVIEQFSA